MGGVNPIIEKIVAQYGAHGAGGMMAKLPGKLVRYTVKGTPHTDLWMKSGFSTLLRTTSTFRFSNLHLHAYYDGHKITQGLLVLTESSFQRRLHSYREHSSVNWISGQADYSEHHGSSSQHAKDPTCTTSSLLSKLAGALVGVGCGVFLLGALIRSRWNGADGVCDNCSTSCGPQKTRPSTLCSNSVLFPQLKLKAQCLQDGGSGIDRPSKRYNFLAEAVEIAAPSVVFIERHQQVTTIFGESMAVSSGSGFIVDDGTYVLTNAHVVGNAKNVLVELKSGRKLKGQVTDMDQVADLALIKVNLPSNEKLPALKFGSSSELRPGEWVVALGSPLSLSNTITAGIVSSVHRPSKELGLQHHKPDMEYVQTDAPITVGNSGGPLVNLDGEVIGVNTMTAGPGISFAIPSDFAKKFVENAAKSVRKKPTLWGAQSRYGIGVSLLSITPRLLRQIRHQIPIPAKVTHGVFLAQVWPNGAASEAGLKKGDVIVRINGKDIHSNSDVIEKVQTGKKLVMEIVRRSRWMTITVQPEPLD